MEFDGRNVTIVAGQHGNEKGTVRALTHRAIDFILGNPEAFDRNVRFIEQDLNASYGAETDTYETRRAKEILERIPEQNLVIDFHTTSAEGPPFVILMDRDMIPFAERSGLSRAVLMTHNIKKGHALINMRDGFAVEISGYDTEDSFQTTLSVLDALESGTRTPMELYEVFDLITEPGDYRNFVEHAAGFFPILVGEASYDFIGLKARKLA